MYIRVGTIRNKVLLKSEETLTSKSYQQNHFTILGDRVLTVRPMGSLDQLRKQGIKTKGGKGISLNPKTG